MRGEQGGIALMDHTGWFYEPEAIGMETAWNKIHYNPIFGEAKEWDFAGYTPQVVVVAIGQNDNHPDDYMKEDYHSEKSRKWRNSVSLSEMEKVLRGICVFRKQKKCHRN
ncbi:hypothetical protein DW061_05945 [Ruminococcus sp. AF42-9BH]|nr:hypothetical protein DXD97_10410 [Ruminococcus sp. TM10-9AT]RHO90210.1 hypothetical protein DW061_05945 [Ruminococcus sp. AF42-9BH]